ncbi:thiamine pyrophosphate-dependent enzyme [Streptomyces solisilvae]|uniref:thiamine pyrophosphate-dependent enzyme n=1 Tax=Streptomyces malaysiensis TaxID=92644 RepID=UPI0036AB791B
MSGHTVATHLVASLAEHGVRRVFGVPSESFTILMEALRAEPALTFVTARHEGGAAFMAEAHAAASGEVGVVLGGRAVGAANLSIGVHTARENSTPLLVLVGQINSRHRGREGFQETDVAAFLGPVAKYAVEESDPRRVPDAVDRALQLALRGRRGPVVLSLPEDVFDHPADAAPARPATVTRPEPSAADAAALRVLLSRAERPVVIAGAGVKQGGAEAGLVAFSEAWQIPVVAAWRRHDVFPNDHPRYAGHLQMGTHPELVATVREADLVLAVGARLNEITTQGYTAPDRRQRIVQVDVEPGQLGKTYPLVLGVHADAAHTLRALGAPAAPRDPAWADQRRAAYLRVTTVEPAEHPDCVDNRQIVRALRAGLPDDAIVTNDAGNFAGWLHTFFRFPLARTYVGAASGAMGYALPAAIGAKLAEPDRTVVSVSGDGGFLMTVQELETAVRLRLSLVALVFNNNMYGSIRMHQERAYPGRVIGSDLGNPDLVGLARAFGAFGARVTADADFPAVLRTALAQPGPAVIEIVTDPEQISVWSTLTQLREGTT